MDQSSQEKVSYVVDKPLGHGLAIVHRIADGEEFLCHEFDIDGRPEMKTLRVLFYRGAYSSAAEVLNHENLISLTGPIRNYAFRGWGNENEKRQYILWDWCDAGTLETILSEPPYSPSVDGFLPESLVWHVAISMFKALIWLHEGWRQRVKLDRKHEMYKTDEDWMPILHRGIEARNIYFQSPKGIETYGKCKLGNYGNCFVSGSVSAARSVIDADDDGTTLRNWAPAITSKKGDQPLESVIKTWWDGRETDFKDATFTKRLYTTGTELFAFGAILYRMMTGLRLPDPDECPLCPCSHFNPETGCPHACVQDVHLNKVIPRLTKYSEGLRTVLERLLLVDRMASERAVEYYELARDSYLSWKANTPDGRLYKDDLDDLIFREQNERRRKAAQQAENQRAMDTTS